MRQTIFILIIFFSSLDIYGQQDTVLIKYNQDWTSDTVIHVTDTVIFPSGMRRHLLIGTTILPFTHNQQEAKGFGLYFNKVTKSDCQQGGEEAYLSQDRINSIGNTTPR